MVIFIDARENCSSFDVVLGSFVTSWSTVTVLLEEFWKVFYLEIMCQCGSFGVQEPFKLVNFHTGLV